MGALVNTTSMVVHGRRDGLSNSRRIGGAHGNDRKRPKAIGFADNLDVIGRWRDDLQENERRDQFQQGTTASLPSSGDLAGWTRRQRELPYALRYHTPLQRRLLAKGGVDNEGGGLSWRSFPPAFKST